MSTKAGPSGSPGILLLTSDEELRSFADRALGERASQIDCVFGPFTDFSPDALVQYALILLDLEIVPEAGDELLTGLRQCAPQFGIPVLGLGRVISQEISAGAYAVGCADTYSLDAGPGLLAEKVQGLLALGRDSWKEGMPLGDMIRIRAELEGVERIRDARSRFFSNMSHELRTPLNGVIGMAQLLSESMVDTQQREYLDTLSASAESLLTLLNNLLDYSSIDAGLLEISPIGFDLRVALEELVGRTCDRVHDKGLDFRLRISSNLPRRVYGDPGRIRQILQVMVDNAIQFTESGHILLHIELLDSDPESAHLRFTVEDTGVGMSPQHLAEVMDESASRWGKSTLTHPGGVGIGVGLSLAKSLVWQMAGSMQMDSVQGQGSRVWFELRLPISVTEAADESAPEPSIAGVRVLIVDDNKVDRWLTAERLSHYQMDCAATSSIQSAREMLEYGVGAGEPFQLLILEKLDAGGETETIDFLQALTMDPEHKDTRVIVYTRSAHRGDAATYGAAGALGFIPKPAKESEFLQMIRDVLNMVTDPDLMEIVTRFRIMEKEHEDLAGAVDGLRVLVVEDNMVNQKVSQRLLETLGCVVTVADDGLDGYFKFQEQPFELIFMDCNMPNMDGYECAKKIRELERSDEVASVPILALTADVTADNRRRCLEAGMNGFLTKPVRLNLVKDAVFRHVRATRLA